jgi:hypothetical protein
MKYTKTFIGIAHLAICIGTFGQTRAIFGQMRWLLIVVYRVKSHLLQGN